MNSLIECSSVESVWSFNTILSFRWCGEKYRQIKYLTPFTTFFVIHRRHARLEPLDKIKLSFLLVASIAWYLKSLKWLLIYYYCHTHFFFLFNTKCSFNFYFLLLFLVDFYDVFFSQSAERFFAIKREA